MEKYSVLMSLYCKEHPEFFEQALVSMINQTIKPDEIVLVEDGPLNEELYSIVDKYKQCLHVVKNDKNIGLGLALNKGLLECRNDLVARMDTDDISKPNRCEELLKRFEENPELAIVGSYIDEFVDSIDNVISQRKVPTDSKSIYEYAKKRSAFNHPSVMYRKAAVLEAGGYNNLRRNQDVDLFGRMVFKGYKTENIDNSLLWFRSSKELNARRKSWENTISYISVIYSFWKMGYSSFIDFGLVTVAQLIMFVLPKRIQSIVYKYFLR